MVRKIALMACGALTLSVALVAAERATFILKNGERVSGVVVFHTEARTNIRADKQEFNVGTTDGREVPIPVDQVSIIDFVGGTPKTAELAALSDSAQTIVMKDGSTRAGRLMDLIGGENVAWQESNGERREIPIRDVARVYLNTQSARTLLDYNPSASSSAPAVTNSTPLGPREFEIRANTGWTDTGLTVRRGERISFSASGQITTGPADMIGPAGNNALRLPSYPVPNMPVGALIGKVGDGAPFFIGGSGQATSPAAGRLMIGINDDHYPDNSGVFKVTVTTARGR